jgi:glycosyltransferase involved in cell wall biosynthesis
MRTLQRAKTWIPASLRGNVTARIVAEKQLECEVTEHPRISVCIATYNGERFLKDQLSSILTQITPTDEVIIVDDASTDGTVDLIRGFGDDRIHLIKHESNQGVVRSFERALRAATGDIIFLSDQDDLWSPNKVTEFLRAFKEHPDSAIIISDATIIDEHDATIARSACARLRFRSGLLANLLHARFVGCRMAFRSTLVPKVLPFPNHLRIVHDIWIGTANWIIGGKTWYIDKPLTFYRLHGDNLTAGARLPLKVKVQLRMDLLRGLIRLKMRALYS